MPQNEARAWWADVEHVREAIERRRAAEQRLAEQRPAAGHLRAVPDVPGRNDAPARSAPAGQPAERRPAAGSGQPAGRRTAHRPGGRRTIEITGRAVPAPAVPPLADPLEPTI